MFEKHEGRLRGGWSFDSGASVGQQRTSDEEATDRAVPFIRSLSCNVASNESETLNKNSMSNSNSCVYRAPTSLKSSVIVDQSRKEISGEVAKEEDRDVKRRLWSEQVVRTRWNDWKDGETGRKNRRRRRNANASTQTLPTVEELEDAETANCSEGSDRNANSDHVENCSHSVGSSRTEPAGTPENNLDEDDVQLCVADILRLLLAPVLAADCQPTTRRSHSPATVPRNSRPHHHRHHYHHHHHPHYQHQHHHLHRYHQQNQRRLCEYNYNQHNRNAVHSSPSGCASCNMQRSDFQDPVAIRSTRSNSPGDSHHWSCPRWSLAAVRGRPVTYPRRRPAVPTSSVPTSSLSSTSQLPPPAAGPDTVPADTDNRSPVRGQLTEEALRQRIERVLVEMISHSDDGHESKVAAALRQAIVDSAAFPTLFTD